MWKYSADAKYTTRVFSDASKAVCYCYVNDVLVLVLLLLLLQPMLQQHTTTTTTRNDDDNDKRRRHWTTTTTTHNCGCDSLYRTITKFFNFAVLECWRVCDCETECSFVYYYKWVMFAVTALCIVQEIVWKVFSGDCEVPEVSHMCTWFGWKVPVNSVKVIMSTF